MKIGILGTDKTVSDHLKTLKKIKNFEISGIFGDEMEYAEKISSQFHITLFRQCQALADESDILCLSGKADGYEDLLIDFTKKSKHIFIHNPGLQNFDFIRLLSKIAEESGSLVYLSQKELHNPVFMSIKPHIFNPLFISIEHQVPEPELTFTDAIHSYLIHIIDIITAIIHSSVKKIVPVTYPIVNSGCYLLIIKIEFSNGSLAQCNFSNLPGDLQLHATIFQQNKKFELDFVNKKAIEYTYSQKNNVVKEFKKKMSIKDSDGFTGEYKSLEEMIRSRTHSVKSVTDYFQSLSLINQINEMLSV